METHLLGDFLDVEDMIDHQYHLEVSSPGIERALRSLDECQRFVGEKVRLKLMREQDGQKVYIGRLQEVSDGRLTVALEQGGTTTFAWEEIQKARLTL